jgi:hypothetical protein
VSSAEHPALTSYDWLDHPVDMKPVALVVAGLVALVCVVVPGVGQAQYMQVEGWVQWVAADRMQLVLDNGLSISVDLTRVPQSQYQGLGPGQRDRVMVVGVIAPDNRRFIASSVTRTSPWGYQSP